MVVVAALVWNQTHGLTHEARALPQNYIPGPSKLLILFRQEEVGWVWKADTGAIPPDLTG